MKLWIVKGSVEPFVTTAAETVTPDKWTGSTGRRHQVLSRGVGETIQDPQALTLPERSTPDKWLGSSVTVPVRQAQIGTRDYTTQSLVVTAAAETITPDKWLGSTGKQQVKTAALVIGNVVQDPQALTLPERTTPDKWLGELGRIVHPRRSGRFGFTAPDRLPDQNVSMDMWLGSAAARVPVVPFPNRNWYAVDTVALTRSETITPDKWLGHLGRIVLPLKSGKALYAAPDQNPTFTVTSDMWLPSVGRPWQQIPAEHAKRSWSILTRSIFTVPNLFRPHTAALIQSRGTEPLVHERTTRPGTLARTTEKA